MRPSESIRNVASKEITLFFSSPIGYLFLVVFAAVSLFVFFWGETFFARNIADVRPLFEWMPILLIFLSAALTMRMWSEERRTGTLEFLMTLPAPSWHFVTGKFIACLVMLLSALAITTPLPITIGIFVDLDWGPIISAYFATFLLGAAYLSIGLYVSSRSDNQIVSLLLTTLIGCSLYLLGSPMLTDFFGTHVGEQLRSLGTGSRFDSITRGVIDMRDFYYYISIVAVFLSLNLYALEKQRWDSRISRSSHRTWRWGTTLLVANLLTANAWLAHIGSLRVDTTRGNIYSISDSTHQYIDQIQEPMLIRGYFSAKTHPLLSPLVPQLKDLIKEYQIAGKGKIRVEFVDPATEPEIEEEANSNYGIRPVPFQISDRYEASVVSSYFNVLIQYGDEFEVLDFRDLIEIKSTQSTEIEVLLRNPEYDVTRSMKKVLYAFQAGGDIFSGLKEPLTFTGYISSDARLPEPLREFRKELQASLDKKSNESNGQLKTRMVDPEANNGSIAKQIEQQFGFRPMATGLLSSDTFFFYMTLSDGKRIVQIPIPEDLNQDSFERHFDSSLKRFASGFLKTVGLATSSESQGSSPFSTGGKQYRGLREVLSTNMNVESINLEGGGIPHHIDLLMIVDPVNYGEKELFAIDQFLMKGGTVVMAASPFDINLASDQMSANRQATGLEPWLKHHGLEIEEKFVMDTQNSSLPIPVQRRVGQFNFREIRRLDYPYFVDVREDGINRENVIVSEIPQLNMAWSSPINIDEKTKNQFDVSHLISSSKNAWLSSSTAITPRIDQNGRTTYDAANKRGQYLLGAVVSGQFSSYFTDKDSPLLSREAAGENSSEDAATEDSSEQFAPHQAGILDRSVESARIILFSSSHFLEDQTLHMAGAFSNDAAQGALLMMANAAEWSLEDRGLLSIRSRGNFNRTLPPMGEGTQMMLEYGNYLLVLFSIAFLAGTFRLYQIRSHKRYRRLLSINNSHQSP